MARHTVRQELIGVLAFIGVIWLVFAIECVLPGRLESYGITPRTQRGLVGIVAAPFLHADFAHLAANTVPLAVLLILLAGSTARSWLVVAAIVLGGGVLLWIFGRSATHIGASGLIYGLIAFLIVSGFCELRIVPLIIAVAVGFLYGGTLIAGVLPRSSSPISWDGHLFGAIAGGLTAYLLTMSRSKLATSTDSEIHSASGKIRGF
jgi:membrane associated rhomboid family serine protease